MASNLLRKLNFITPGASVAAPSAASKVKEFVQSYPLEDGIRRLNQSALIDMGLTGGTFDINRAVFIDTETTGLSGGAGTVAFLIGYGYADGESFVVKQLLMPDYSCEAEMLITLSKELARFDTFVHFNGTRFDIPLINERCTMKRLNRFAEGFNQLDLLYPSRRVWKLRLGSCRLSYLESAVLGMEERDDIPGSEIPGRYFESVKTGNLSLLDDVIAHNRQDIVTLATLLVKLNSIYAKPEDTEETLDLYSLGKAFEQLGQKRVAKGLYLKASRPRAVLTARELRNEKYAGEANYRLFLLLRRNGEYEKCEQTLLNMIKRRQKGYLPILEICKLYEHRIKNYPLALKYCKMLYSSDFEDKQALNNREKRIISKINKTEATK